MTSQAQPPKIDNIKIALLGNSGVGKTCIINRYIKNEFKAENESTIGANYQQKVISRNGKTLQLDLWDTAGQEKYRSLGKHFYKNAYIVIFVYDISVKESFTAIKDIWYNDIKTFGEKYSVFAVVGNKSDKFEEEDVDENLARAYAKEINAIFMLVSAQNGSNIENLFDAVVDAYLGPEFQPKAKEMIAEKEENTSGNVQIKKNDDQNEKKKGCGC